MLKLSELTPAEAFVLVRRRHSLSQAEMAEMLGVTLYRLLQWEGGTYYEDDPPPRGREDLRKLELHEAFFILRKRAGLTMAQVADRVGLSTYWISRVESGDPDVQEMREAVRKFWRKQSARLIKAE